MSVNKVDIIRDAVHGYIPYSNLEKEFMSHPLFQRLQYVGQNGLAYMTYPSNRTSRFAHCLGTMHVGTQMLRCAISASGYAGAFLRDSKQRLRGLVTRPFERVERHLRDIEAWLRKNPDPFYQSLGLTPERIWPIILVQSLRLACIAHDLGHPPFGHTLEPVLEYHAGPGQCPHEGGHGKSYDRAFRFLRGRPRAGSPVSPALHESCGAVLAHQVFADVFRGVFEKKFFEACLSVAAGIVVTRHGEPLTEEDALLAPLHEIVSGAVDADRADYVLRDGAAFGLEAVNYDLPRILGNMRVGRERRNSHRFLFRPTTQATSGVEGFFQARYRLWRWAIYHQSVVRANVALQRAVSALLDIYLNPGSYPAASYRSIRKVLDQEGFDRLWSVFSRRGGQTASREKISAFCYCDDAWLMGVLRKVSLVPSIMKRRLPQPLALLRAYLGVVCRRETGLMQALWKRIEQYREFTWAFGRRAKARCFCPLFKESGPLSALGPLLGDQNRSVELCNGVLSQILGPEAEGKRILAELRKLERRVNEGQDEKAICLDFHEFKPYPEPFTVCDEKSGELKNFAELSPSTASLNRAWSGEIQLHAFVTLLRDRTGEGEPEGDPLKLPNERARLGSMLAGILLKQKLEDFKKSQPRRR